MNKPSERMSEEAMITKANIGKFTWDDYEKIGTTRLSRETLPAGTKVETLEGEYTCAESSRLAVDVNGNVYPVADSVFQKSYRRALGTPDDVRRLREKAKILDAVLENHGAIISEWRGFKSPPEDGKCGCDPDVGFYCTDCALHDLMRHLAGISDALAPASLDQTRETPAKEKP